MRILLRKNHKFHNYCHSNAFEFSQLRQIYFNTIKQRKMNHDLKQVEVIQKFQYLNDSLIDTHRLWKDHAARLSIPIREIIADPVKKKENQKQKKKSNFFSLFSKDFSTYNKNLRVPGVYLYGGSGCGKSFLSDIFYDNLQIVEKKKVHFHQFMAGIHAQLFKLQRQKKGFDPLIQVARKTAMNTRLLYLDQFQVTDVADASILKRLFQRLITNELVLLATSNRHPTDLYKNGHQRQFFIPFIDFLQTNCQVIHLNSFKDYRYSMEMDNSQITQSYISPVDQVSDAKLNRLFSLLAGVQNPVFEQVTLEPVKGRKLIVPYALNKVCFYQFNQLVDRIMGDSDFRAICKNFKAIIIKNMYVVKRHQRNIANRLIKLFDQAYFRNVKIYINGTTGLEDIIQALPQSECKNQEDFAMTRCKSRLMQFQTKQYKQKPSYVQLHVNKTQEENVDQKIKSEQKIQQKQQKKQK